MFSVNASEGYVLDMDFWMPSHCGDTEVVSLPHLFLTADAEIDGNTATMASSSTAASLRRSRRTSTPSGSSTSRSH